MLKHTNCAQRGFTKKHRYSTFSYFFLRNVNRALNVSLVMPKPYSYEISKANIINGDQW